MILPVPLPNCGLCSGWVDSIEWTADPVSGVVVFTARRHGQEESVEVPIRLLQRATTIEPGLAFRQPTTALEPQ